MARSYCRFIDIQCIDCATTHSISWWSSPDNESAAPEWNDAKVKSLTCACPEGKSHWQFPSTGSGGKGITARSSQGKAVVYQLPDGDYMAPDSNDPRSEMARAAADVGVRREFSTLSELRSFQREQQSRKREIWQRMIDSGEFEGTSLDPSYQQLEAALERTGHNDVLDYNEGTIRDGGGLTHDQVRERMERQREMTARREEARRNYRKEHGGSKAKIGSVQDLRRYERLRGKR